MNWFGGNPKFVSVCCFSNWLWNIWYKKKVSLGNRYGKTKWHCIKKVMIFSPFCNDITLSICSAILLYILISIKYLLTCCCFIHSILQKLCHGFSVCGWRNRKTISFFSRPRTISRPINLKKSEKKTVLLSLRCTRQHQSHELLPPQYLPSSEGCQRWTETNFEPHGSCLCDSSCLSAF